MISPAILYAGYLVEYKKKLKKLQASAQKSTKPSTAGAGQDKKSD